MICSTIFCRKTERKTEMGKFRVSDKMIDSDSLLSSENLTFVRVSNRPRIDVTTMHPTKKNETCWLQNATSISKPHQCTAISMPRVTGSFLPTRSNIMLIVQMNIFHKQYRLKKCPSTLKYLPCNVSAHRWRSCILRSACTSKNNCRDNSSAAPISSRNCPISMRIKQR